MIHGNALSKRTTNAAFERWTFHEEGYSDLLKIGERDSNENPYIDAQHPHSSLLAGRVSFI